MFNRFNLNQPGTIERLQHLVEENCRAVIDDNHELAVTVAQGAENVVFEVHCDAGDMGLIIGKNGKNIDAMRTLVCSACRGANIRTGVEVLDSRRKTRG